MNRSGLMFCSGTTIFHGCIRQTGLHCAIPLPTNRHPTTIATNPIRTKTMDILTQQRLCSANPSPPYSSISIVRQLLASFNQLVGGRVIIHRVTYARMYSPTRQDSYSDITRLLD